MLVLTRKEGEELKMGDDIIIRVLSVSGNRIKVGVLAPDNVRVMRGELLGKGQQPKDSHSQDG